MNASARPLDRAVAREAAAWLVRLREDATPALLAACERWRAADPEHERAWRLAQQLDAKFGIVPPKVGMAALGREARSDRRAAVRILALLLAAGPAGYLAYRGAPWQAWTSDERTATGERRSVVLADGTRIDLNTATSLDVAFGASERLVVLHAGEILVETGADADSPGHRPFVVRTRQGRIRALGTRFVVSEGQGADTRVAVLHGAVEITPAGAPGAARVVEAGQQVRFTQTSIGTLAQADPHVADWTRGVLFADGMRLGDFVAELRRYRPGMLRCDPAVAGLRLTGAFQIDNIDGILAALPQTLPVKVSYLTRYWVTIAPVGAGG